MSTTTVTCRIESLETLDAGVTRVFLRITDGQDVPYAPGQYLELSVEVEGEQRWVPFSIGNAYRGEQLLELHILEVPSSKSNTALFQRLRVGETFDVRLPSGKSVVEIGDKRPLLLVAAGTGFAQMKAITEAVLAHDPDHPIDLWWATRTREDLYLDDLAREWAATHSNFHYHPVVEEFVVKSHTYEHGEPVESREQEEQDAFDGLVERVDRALAKTLKSTQKYSIYISGSPGMVYSVMDALEEIEPLTEYVFSDVFSYAPRPEKPANIEENIRS
ncbi:Terephthalate 1,2-dioxygenase, reductase component 1 [Halomonadaceae bacterium LMG 33818]|uniref:FAD-binding oxidoreductase n=1 Tax=Cernens ardua TaxID=3402176 RepID=UPI003EDC53DA